MTICLYFHKTDIWVSQDKPAPEPKHLSTRRGQTMFDVQFLRAEGLRAFEMGLDLEDNPYDKDSAEYKVWAAGWRHAERRFAAEIAA